MTNFGVVSGVVLGLDHNIKGPRWTSSTLNSAGWEVKLLIGQAGGSEAGSSEVVRHGNRPPDLQSLSWGAFSIGGLLGSVSSGMLVDALGPRRLFLIGVVCPLSLVVAGMMRLMPEERLPPHERRVDLTWLKTHTVLVALAVYMSVISVILSGMQTFMDDKVARAVTTLTSGVVLVFGVYFLLRRISVVLAKTAVFILLRDGIQPNTGEAMFQWLTKADEGPKFSPTVIGWVDIFSYMGLLVGVTLYNTYCTKVSYRKIFAVAQIAHAFTNLFDFALVMRWNLLIGLPDVLMLIGDDAVTNVMSRFCSMPMFVLASKVCPDSVEATLFALLMSLANFGGNVANLFGVSLLEFSGVVDGNYDNFPAVIIMKSVFRLLPLLIIPILVPNLTPNDPIDPIETESDSGSDECSESSDYESHKHLGRSVSTATSSEEISSLAGNASWNL
eukprot:TRINITY_DN15807_c0_g1_i3.p1 TRINITY_DN15807_c0_g1~~TRINITY_DN15807_c0_g1_i3.p1  ORF type:complete len:444 (+),score=42.89 TRINITY_DN15807_c0_g1_i3:749-2080(+)